MTVIKRNRKRLTGFAVFCLCALAAVLSYSIFFVSAESPLPPSEPTTVSLASSDDLITYSREYARGGHNPDDTIQLALSSGSAFVIQSGETGYVPIGSVARPFNGKIEIADNATNRFISDVPLFGAVTTDAKVVNASGAVRELLLARLEGASVPLFAETVTKGAVNTGAHWRVTIEADARDAVNLTAYPFAGVIGSVADECKLRVDFTHSAVSSAGTPGNAESAGDLGLICGSPDPAPAGSSPRSWLVMMSCSCRRCEIPT